MVYSRGGDQSQQSLLYTDALQPMSPLGWLVKGSVSATLRTFYSSHPPGVYIYKVRMWFCWLRGGHYTTHGCNIRRTYNMVIGRGGDSESFVLAEFMYSVLIDCFEYIYIYISKVVYVILFK